MKMFDCCMNCTAPKRHPACHSDCEDYKAAKAKWGEIQDAMRLHDGGCRELLIQGARKAKRRHGKK